MPLNSVQPYCPFSASKDLRLRPACQFHDQEMDPLPHLQGKDLDDARVAYLAREVDLALDAQELFFIFGQPRIEELDRQPRIQGQVQGCKDDAEAALADQLLQAIASVDHRSRRQLDQVEVGQFLGPAAFVRNGAAGETNRFFAFVQN